nr:hypothetical protein [Tanacetum cinerariifolium]
MHEEEEADELYHDVNINQGRGLQVSQDIDNSHVTLTPVHSDGQQESSLMLSFVTSLLNPIIDPGMESIFTTASSSVTPLPSPTSTMTPSIITTTRTTSQPPIPSTPILNGRKQVYSLIRRTTYKALVEAYEADKTILDSYGESAILKKRHEDDDDQEEPFAGSDWGSKRRREGGEHASASTPSEPAIRSQQYPHNLLQPFSLIPDNRGRHVILFEHFINNDLEYLRGGASSRKYTTSVTKTKAADYGHIKWIEDLVPHTMWIQEPLNYDKHPLWGVSYWGQKRQQFYRFTVNRESALDDVYEEYRLSAACGRSSTASRKLPEEAQPYKARHVSIRSKATRSIYCLFEPRGFIYQNKDKKNRLRRIDELQKFSDGTLNDVRNALDDCLKGIRMQYLPTTIWRKGDKDRAAAMIQAIDKMLKTRRIMRSLERFFGGTQYEGDFRILQRTI